MLSDNVTKSECVKFCFFVLMPYNVKQNPFQIISMIWVEENLLLAMPLIIYPRSFLPENETQSHEDLKVFCSHGNLLLNVFPERSIFLLVAVTTSAINVLL